MDARALLSKLRGGDGLSAWEARWFGEALNSDDVSDAQAGAFAMAICAQGLSARARVGLTEGMRDSGEVLSWDLPGPVLDKHSTGGVGDPVSLVLAPALAACGVFVPMISGRGLGHTGGTLDKLEAIPGYVSEVGAARLEHVVREAGFAIVGASGRIAPSDKRLYAVRDVTGTVDSIDLITASILAKKLAAGLDGLVLDVKTGAGAVMADPDQAGRLAETLVQVANGAGCTTSALITDMSQPLVPAAGNALEIRAVMRALSDPAAEPFLIEVATALGALLLSDAGQVQDPQEGHEKISHALTSGRAMEQFTKMVSLMGGAQDFWERWTHLLPEANIQREVVLDRSGYIATIDTRALGEVVVQLGGGRLREGDQIDPAVGLSNIARIGDRITKAMPVAMIHASDETKALRAMERVRSAFELAEEAVSAPSLIHRQVTL